MTNLCKNIEDGDQMCGGIAVAQLAVRIGNLIYPTDSTMDLCMSHLLHLMVRNGVTPADAVDLISTVGTRIALDILDEERQGLEQ